MTLPRSLLAASAALLCLRLYAAKVIGFGDSEALYACYTLHPDWTYLDHPGLVGAVLSLLHAVGGSAGPIPMHVASALVATAFPILFFFVAMHLDAESRRAEIASLLALATPELSIGLFGFTPDLLLAPLWLLALYFLSKGLRNPGSRALTGALLFAALATAAKASGALLLVASVGAVFHLPRDLRKRATRPSLLGASLALVVLFPFVATEAKKHFPMLAHRLIASQSAAGFSWRNAAALLGGQLAYLSPFVAAVLILRARPLARGLMREPTGRSRLFVLGFPLGALTVFCLWSRVAEPHWLAPAWLTLGLALTLSTVTFPTWLLRSAFGLAFTLTLGVHAWVLVPELHRYFPAPAEAKHDISSELFGWPEAIRTLEEVRETYPSARIIGPHWTLCAQVHAALGPAITVGCETPIPDDFDTWFPRGEFQAAPLLIQVTDNRFPAGPRKGYRTLDRRRAHTFRGGRSARTFEITVFEREGPAPAKD